MQCQCEGSSTEGNTNASSISVGAVLSCALVSDLCLDTEAKHTHAQSTFMVLRNVSFFGVGRGRVWPDLIVGATVGSGDAATATTYIIAHQRDYSTPKC